MKTSKHRELTLIAFGALLQQQASTDLVIDPYDVGQFSEVARLIKEKNPDDAKRLLCKMLGIRMDIPVLPAIIEAIRGDNADAEWNALRKRLQFIEDPREAMELIQEKVSQLPVKI